MKNSLIIALLLICYSCKNNNPNKIINEIAIEQLEKSSAILIENSETYRQEYKSKKPLTAQPQTDSSLYSLCKQIHDTTIAILKHLNTLNKKENKNSWEIFYKKYKNYLKDIEKLDAKSKIFESANKLKIISNKKLDSNQYINNNTFNNLTEREHKLFISNFKNNILYIENKLMEAYQSRILFCGMGGYSIGCSILQNTKHIKKGEMLEVEVIGTSNKISFNFMACIENENVESKDGYVCLKLPIKEAKGKYKKTVTVTYFDSDNEKHGMQKNIEYTVY